MPQLKVTDNAGEEFDIEFIPGNSLMQTLVEAGMSDLLALCGGVCSCGTCHVYLEEPLLDRLPPPDEDEQALLSMLEVSKANSRLSCQLRLTEGFDGARITIAEQSP